MDPVSTPGFDEVIEEAVMEPDRSAIAWTRALLHLPLESSERLTEEWAAVRRRIDIVHGVSVPRETEPSGAPRLAPGEESTARDGADE